VAVLAGVGGWAGAVVAGQLDPRDPSAALGFVAAMKDLPDHTKPGDKLYVFALPCKAALVASILFALGGGAGGLAGGGSRRMSVRR
jgi:hypothetical protein